MVDKIDFKKTLPGYRASHNRFDLVDIPDMQYLMIDGHGDPNIDSSYADALATLYPVAYALKFASKRELGRDYVVPPLEGLWWAADMTVFTSARDKSQWDWTMMLMAPDWVDLSMFDHAVEQTAAKSTPARLDEIRLSTLSEGLCVQTLHIGSYDNEGPILDTLHNVFIPEQGYTLSGKHHEIYLSDPRKVAAERLRTILRQPVSPL